MNLEKVIFGFFIVLAATLNFGFFIGDIDRLNFTTSTNWPPRWSSA